MRREVKRRKGREGGRGCKRVREQEKRGENVGKLRKGKEAKEAQEDKGKIRREGAGNEVK